MRLKNGTEVRVHSTSSHVLDGQICTVVGIASEALWGVGTIYIVKLPEDFYSASYEYDCIGLTEACLTVVE